MKLISPFIIITIIFFLNFLSHAVAPELFGGVSLKALIIVLIYYFSFAFGYFFITKFIPNIKTAKFDVVEFRLSFTLCILVLFVILAFFAFVLYSNGFSSFGGYRQFVFSEYESKGLFYWLLRFISFYIFMAIVSLVFFPKKIFRNVILFFVVLVISVIGTGRTYLLMYFMALFVFTLNMKNRLFGIAFLVVAFILSFSLFVVFFNKADGTSLLEVLESLLSYFLLPMHGFSYMLESEEYYGYLITFSPGLLEVFGMKAGYNPWVMPYTPEPFVTNVYTMFFPIYYDFGYLGIVFFAVLYGVVHEKIYKYARCGGGFSKYLYVLSLYPLSMSVFFDVYVSSIGLWVFALLFWFLVRKEHSSVRNESDVL